MSRNLARLTDAQLFINHGIERIRSEAVTSDTGIDTIHLDRLDPAFPQGFVIYELLSSGYGFKGDVIDALCHSLEQDATGRRFYARERVASIDRGKIVIAPIAPDDACLTTVRKGAPRSYCGNSVLYYEYCDIDTIKNFGVPENIAQMDADRLQFPLTLRRWRDGDWFVPFGMTGRKRCRTSSSTPRSPWPRSSGSSCCCRATRSSGSSDAASTTATALRPARKHVAYHQRNRLKWQRAL
ncbi:MAG: tRNA lysidine(34) synthetase TilS C-terminal domain-containing protein [Alistipes shahii]